MLTGDAHLERLCCLVSLADGISNPLLTGTWLVPQLLRSLEGWEEPWEMGFQLLIWHLCSLYEYLGGRGQQGDHLGERWHALSI